MREMSEMKRVPAAWQGNFVSVTNQRYIPGIDLHITRKQMVNYFNIVDLSFTKTS